MSGLDRRVGVQLDDLDFLDGRGAAGIVGEFAVRLRNRAEDGPDGIPDGDVRRRGAPDQQHRQAHRLRGLRIIRRRGQSVTAFEHVLKCGTAKQVAKLPGAESAPFAQSHDDRTRRQSQRLLQRGALAKDHRQRAELARIQSERIALCERSAHQLVDAGLRADDGVSLVVPDHDGIARVAQIAVDHRYAEARLLALLV